MKSHAHSALIMFAIVAALGLVGAITADIVLTSEEADAKCPVFLTGYNASKGRCNPG